MSLETQFDLSFRILFAAIMVGIVGYNRQQRGEAAGLRTHILIGIGAALFTSLSLNAFGASNGAAVAAQIVTGVGFLGAGNIIRGEREGEHVRGITTAAGMWTSAAIGMASGTGFYFLAFFGALLAWFVLVVVRRVERREQVEALSSPGEKDGAHTP